jgi:hypothetical protein
MEHFLLLDTLTYRLMDEELYYLRMALSIFTILACNNFCLKLFSNFKYFEILLQSAMEEARSIRAAD